VRVEIACRLDSLCVALGEQWLVVTDDVLPSLVADADPDVRSEAIRCLPRLARLLLGFAMSGYAEQPLAAAAAAATAAAAAATAAAAAAATSTEGGDVGADAGVDTPPERLETLGGPCDGDGSAADLGDSSSSYVVRESGVGGGARATRLGGEGGEGGGVVEGGEVEERGGGVGGGGGDGGGLVEGEGVEGRGGGGGGGGEANSGVESGEIVSGAKTADCTNGRGGGSRGGDGVSVSGARARLMEAGQKARKRVLNALMPAAASLVDDPSTDVRGTTAVTLGEMLRLLVGFEDYVAVLGSSRDGGVGGGGGGGGGENGVGSSAGGGGSGGGDVGGMVTCCCVTGEEDEDGAADFGEGVSNGFGGVGGGGGGRNSVVWGDGGRRVCHGKVLQAEIVAAAAAADAVAEAALNAELIDLAEFEDADIGVDDLDDSDIMDDFDEIDDEIDDGSGEEVDGDGAQPSPPAAEDLMGLPFVACGQEGADTTGVVATDEEDKSLEEEHAENSEEHAALSPLKHEAGAAGGAVVSVGGVEEEMEASSGRGFSDFDGGVAVAQDLGSDDDEGYETGQDGTGIGSSNSSSSSSSPGSNLGSSPGSNLGSSPGSSPGSDPGGSPGSSAGSSPGSSRGSGDAVNGSFDEDSKEEEEEEAGGVAGRVGEGSGRGSSLGVGGGGEESGGDAATPADLAARNDPLIVLVTRLLLDADAHVACTMLQALRPGCAPELGPGPGPPTRDGNPIPGAGVGGDGAAAAGGRFPRGGGEGQGGGDRRGGGGSEGDCTPAPRRSCMLTPSQVGCVLPAFSELFGNPLWRVRAAVAEALPALVSCTLCDRLRDEVVNLGRRMLHDRVDSVRRSAAEQLIMAARIDLDRCPSRLFHHVPGACRRQARLPTLSVLPLPPPPPNGSSIPETEVLHSVPLDDLVANSVKDSVPNSVKDSAADSVSNSVEKSVKDSVANSVKVSVPESVANSVAELVSNSVANSAAGGTGENTETDLLALPKRINSDGVVEENNRLGGPSDCVFAGGENSPETLASSQGQASRDDEIG
ncbi:unnamed protein product, partial [Laminaria digitata]